jgi:hypothetical protein
MFADDGQADGLRETDGFRETRRRITQLAALARFLFDMDDKRGTQPLAAAPLSGTPVQACSSAAVAGGAVSCSIS